MPVITLETPIAAPPEIVFDLARSIDLHKISTAHTHEEAIAGKTSGLIAMDESVTWRAKHFGITQNLTSKITQYNRPHSFTDEMVKGAFKSFRHRHLFTCEGDITIMTDVFEYQSPLGLLGKAADVLFLKRYMQKLLIDRNRVIKQFAEDEVLYSKVLT
jgi:ligand-binding SRPBCC domain-containing protein